MVLPAISAAVTVNELEPEVRLVFRLKAPLVRLTGVPFTLTRAIGSLSVTVPPTVSAALFVMKPAGGEVRTTVGGVLSIFTEGDLNVALLPATW